MKKYSVLLFDSKELNREVRVFLMLPSRYDKSQKKYPVLYMHDGQNLFDPLTGYKNQTWGILDTYEEHPELPAELGFDAYGDQDYGGKTDDYLCFIINQVKPYIDKHYRTYKSAKNTAIMGSSFGGVCSMYAALEYGEYFSRFGCVSNAHYVVQKDIEDLARNSSVSHIKKFYMDVGTKESSNAIESQNYIDSNQAVFNIFLQKMEQKKLRFVLAEGAIHNEEAWRVRFADIVSFLFND